MKDVVLLGALESIHKTLENMNSAPSTFMLICISSLSGLIGVLLGFLIQSYREEKEEKSKANTKTKLLEYELNRLRENAAIAIKTCSYLLNNHLNIDRKKILVPNPSLRMFYERHFVDIAHFFSDDKRDSTTVAYEQILELDNSISYIEDSTSSNLDMRLYNYEYIMSLATMAYKHAENALSDSPTPYKSVCQDHVKLANNLGCRCPHLEIRKNRKIIMR
ncbi:hypothetical protein [Yersinia proxima]|uniref:hypothetical protein n=1 Tax=Yersinia proxima TaxID=2890316 RepID=UPI000980DB0B|nr:hypothetical protein [Yersinia proxima]